MKKIELNDNNENSIIDRSVYLANQSWLFKSLFWQKGNMLDFCKPLAGSFQTVMNNYHCNGAVL